MKTESHLQGLSQEVAKQRLQAEGRNELSRGKRYTWLSILLTVLREPMFLLLLISSLIYLFLGDIHEALMLCSMIFLVIGITFYQQNRTEHTLDSLRELSSPRALVIRDSIPQRIPGHEVVREDLVILSEGDRVPADGILVSGFGLSVDESLLTGESIPVRKAPLDSEIDRVYAGTLVVNGQGMMQVQFIGQHTALGKIGRSLESLGAGSTVLQKEVARLVRLFAGWGFLLCLIVLFTYGFVRSDWLSGFLAGITLAMSVLPEELPMILTVFLALGAWRIAKNHVLTRNTHTLEELGSATVLCTDKTGTLTLNQMTIVRLATLHEGELDLGNSGNPSSLEVTAFQELMTCAYLASQQTGYDPMDIAATKLAQSHVADPILNSYRLDQIQRVYPLSKSMLAVTIVWPDSNGKYTVAMKGAPEKIFSLCDLDLKQRATVMEMTKKMGAEGLRVLAVAKGYWDSDSLPESPEAFPLNLMGLLGYIDPIRPTVPEAVQACYSAGIRVLMITGDYPETARGIARQIRLRNCEEVLTGDEIHQMSDKTLLEQVEAVDIYARMLPEHKLRLVNALKSNQEIVAMTGDGVNDAPALKAAHIGIAMGKRGTDVAREAADLVLLDDDFSSIVDAIRQGRRIFENLRKAMAYIFSTHIPIAGMAILPVIFNWPLLLFPAHIALIQMIIDPACSVAFEAEPPDGNVMVQPPRAINEPLFNKKIFMQAAFQGNISFLVTLSVYGMALWQHYGDADARTMGFTTLLVSNLMLITTNLAGQAPILTLPFIRNKAYWWLTSIALIILSLLLTLPALQELFYFSRLHTIDYAICIIAAILCLALLELPKYLRQKI